MKINNIKPQSTGKKIILTVLLVGVGGLITVGALEWFNVTNFFLAKPYQAGGPTTDEVKQRERHEAEQKKKFIEDKTVDNAQPAPVPGSSDAIELTTERTSNNELTVFTQLKGYASGGCELKVTNGSKAHSENAAIIYQPEYSVCAGFSVPVSKLGTGTWAITLIVTGSDGSTQAKQITAEVE